MPTGAAPVSAPYVTTPIPFTIGPTLSNSPISHSDITTLVVNPTTSSQTYSYLPPHGRTLASKTSIVINGDINGYLMGNQKYNRKLNGLLNDIQSAKVHVFRNERILITVNVIAAQTVAVGDLVYLSTADAYKAANFTWDTNLATTQASFVNSFLGIATQAKTSTTVAGQILVDISPNSAYYMTCASETHIVGDTMGPDKDSGNAILSATLEKAVAASACARVVQRNASAATKVVVRFQSAYWGFNAAASQ